VGITDGLIKIVRDRLREFGIDLELEPPGSLASAGIDAVATLTRADATARYAVRVGVPMTLSSLVRAAGTRPPYPLLVVGDQVSRRSAASLRDAGIQFLDTLGNAFIDFDGVLVEVQGRTEPAGRDRDDGHQSARPGRPANMFSSRRAQVIFALLAWPELATGKVREIAHAAGASVGQAHDTLAQLRHSGFLNSASNRLDRTDELLDYWSAAYPTGLGRRIELARYHGDPSRRLSRPDPDQSIYLSGESAAGVDIARPATLTIYLEGLDPRLPIANRWSSSPERTRNVFVRHKFWVSPRLGEGRSPASRRNVPWPLVYADLLDAGDARLDEVARDWRAHHARLDEV